MSENEMNKQAAEKAAAEKAAAEKAATEKAAAEKAAAESIKPEKKETLEEKGLKIFSIFEKKFLNDKKESDDFKAEFSRVLKAEKIDMAFLQLLRNKNYNIFHEFALFSGHKIENMADFIKKINSGKISLHNFFDFIYQKEK